MNKDKLIHILHQVSRDKDVSFNILLQLFFFESLLYRLSQSRYKDQVILKGGFLLSSILGITQRSTLDLDFSVRNIDFTKDAIEDMTHEIIKIDAEDDIVYQLLKITEIMQHSQSAGYRISMMGSLENIRVPFSVDIAVGDPITPHDVHYNYQPILLEKGFVLNTYNIETILAEKLQTIIDKTTSNSRMKDFYDIYIISKSQNKLFDPGILKNAVKNTFEDRHTDFNQNNFLFLLNNLEDDEAFIKRWMNYVKKNHYVDDIKFEDIRKEIIKLTGKIE